MPDIYAYTDYRAFLRDYYRERKRENPKFSHRFFALKAGLKSSGFFSDVMTGKRNLTRALALKFAAALKLRKGESEYFQNLVGYCQSRTTEEKAYYFEKMVAVKEVTVKKVERDKFEFYSTWYYSAIRELLYFYPFDGDYEALAKKLNPPITVDEARKGIELLLRLGFIRKERNGKYVQCTPLITTGSDFKSLYVAQFQRATMKLAYEAIDRFPASLRDSSTVTMTLSAQSFEAAKNELAQCRKRLLAIAERDQTVDRVYQFNMQLFPLSRF